MMESGKHTAVVLGGGTGGLFTGAVLSRLGWKVTVLEKNANVGGGLQTFSRGDVTFNPGMHIVGGFGKGGAAAKFFEWLGIEGVEVEPCPQTLHLLSGQENSCPFGGKSVSACKAAVKTPSDALEIDIPEGFEAFEERLSEFFPESRSEIHNFLSRIREISGSVPMLRLEAGEFNPEGDALLPFDEFISKYIGDTRLRGILAWLNPLSGAEAGRTPAFISAIISSLYISGSYRFKGGTLPLVNSLKRIIESGGGSIVAGAEVTEILTEDSAEPESSAQKNRRSGKKVSGVRTLDGKVYRAGTYISDLSPLALLSLCPEGTFPKVFCRRVLAQRPGISMFCVYVKLYSAPKNFVAEFLLSGEDSPWKSGEELLLTSEGRSLTIMTPIPVASCPGYADKNASGIGSDAGASKGDSRSEEYRAWKQMMTEKILKRAEVAFPEILSGNIEGVWAATPATLSRYGSPDGAAYGFGVDAANPLYSRFGPKTYLPNLFQTGQSVFLHGFCGVMMSSLLTCREVAGEGFDAVLGEIREGAPKSGARLSD